MGGFARVAAFAALGGFLFGYDLAVIGGAIPFMQPELGLSEGEVELVVSAAKFGAVLATPLAGYVMLRYGRRPALALSAAAFCAGPGIMAVAPGLGLLALGRLVVGFGIGLSAVASPAFLAEMAPAAMRGTVVSAYELMLCLGMVCAALMDYLLARVSTAGGGFGDGNWRLMLAVPAGLGGLLACALSMLPESPRWLVSKGRMEDALAVIEQLRDSSSSGSGSGSGSAAARGAGAGAGGARRKRDHAAEVEQELLELWSAVEKEKAEALEASGIQLFTHTAVFDRASQRLVVSPGLGPVTREQDGSVARGHGFVLRDALSPAGSWQELRAAWRELLHGPAALPPGPPGGAAAAGTPAPASAADEGDDATAARAATASAAVAEPAANANTDADADADGASAARERAKQAARRPLVIVAWLALINQLTASTAIINYAPKIFEDLGVVDQGCVWEVAEGGGGALAEACAALPDKAACSAASAMGDGASMQCAWEADRGQAALLAAGLGLAKLVGVGLTMYLGVLDGAGHGGGEGGEGAGAGRGKSSMLAACLCGAGGRRAVLIRGAVTQGLSMFALSAGVASGSAALVIASTLAFVLFFAASWAGAFWVVVSEAFSMRLKAVAAPLATALLFLFGALIDALFLSLVNWFGAFAFSIFGGVALAGGAYVHWYLPETQGCTLAEANRRYASDQRAEGAAAGGAGGSLCGRHGGGNGQQRWESLREDGSLNDGLVAQDARQPL
jgi:MFS family permease